MSVWKSILGRQFWVGLAIMALALLFALAAGALLITVGLVLPTSAWVLVCAAWGIAGFVGGRYALLSGEQWLLRGIAGLTMTMAFFWIAGLTSPDPAESGAVNWLWHVVSGLAGTLAAAVAPCKVRRKRGKRKVKNQR